MQPLHKHKEQFRLEKSASEIWFNLVVRLNAACQFPDMQEYTGIETHQGPLFFLGVALCYNTIHCNVMHWNA